MLTSPFPFFSGGNTELTAGMVNDMLEQMRRQSQFLSAPPVEVRRVGDGWQIRLRGRRGLWAVCDEYEGRGLYSWKEAVIGPDAGWTPKVQGRSGGGPLAAREINGRDDVLPGTVLWLEPLAGVDGGEDAFAFLAPLPADSPASLMWAVVTDTDGETYGYREQYFDGNLFTTPPLPFTSTAGDDTSAVEVSGASVPIGTVVLLSHDPTDGDRVRYFEYAAAGDGGFWARLVRESVGAEYTADLAGATSGSWSVSFARGSTPAPGTTSGTVSLSFDTSADDAQAALDEFTAGDVVVTSGGGGLVFTFVDNLTGESGASLTASFSLGFDDTGGENPEPTFEQTEVGRDLPFTAGGAKYAYKRLEFGDDGRLVAGVGDDAAGSVWPACLARESRGVTNVPEGSVVRVRPGRTGLMSLATAKADDGFGAAWSEEDVEAHFAEIDNGDGTITDSGVDFTWWGECSHWAELTEAADERGLYPFRLVHLGGDEKADLTELQADGGNPDFADAEVEDLRRKFLHGTHGYHELVEGIEYRVELKGATGGTFDLTFEPGGATAEGIVGGTATVAFDATAEEVQAALDPFAEDDFLVVGDPGNYTITFVNDLAYIADATLEATFAVTYGTEEAATSSDPEPAITKTEPTNLGWVASRPGGREVTGLARDMTGRRDFRPGTVVRVFSTPFDADPAFWFMGSPTAIWATLTGESEAGLYDWEELDPPTDRATGLPFEARTGTAREQNGREAIPDDTVVLLTPDGDGGEYRFHCPGNAADGGRDCRVLLWEGGGTATIVSGPDDAVTDGDTVSIRFLPEDDAEDLMPHGHHVGFRAPGSTEYVIPVPFGFHSDRTHGYVTTGEQLIAGTWNIRRGGLIVTGSGTTTSIPSPNQYWANVAGGTYGHAPLGQTILTSDGALAMDGGGPRIVAGGGVLNLENAAFMIRPNLYWSGTGTLDLPARGDGAPGSITFKGGIFVSGTSPTESSPMFTGSFTMRPFSAFPFSVSVNVVNGVVVPP